MQADRFINQAECQKLVSLSRATIYRLRRLNLFPQNYQLSPGRYAYKESEILEWMGNRPKRDIARLFGLLGEVRP